MEDTETYPEQEFGYQPKHFHLESYKAIKPTSDHVLVELEEPPKYTDSGAILISPAHSGLARELWGSVIAVGPGRRRSKGAGRVTMGVLPWERVMFRSNSGSAEHVCDGRTRLILTESQILAVEDPSGS